MRWLRCAIGMLVFLAGTVCWGDHIPTDPPNGARHLDPKLKPGPLGAVPFRNDDPIYGKHKKVETHPELWYKPYFLGRRTNRGDDIHIYDCNSPGPLEQGKMARTTCGKPDENDAPAKNYWLQFEAVLLRLGKQGERKEWDYFVRTEFVEEYQETFEHDGGEDAWIYAQWYLPDFYGELSSEPINITCINLTKRDIWWSATVTEERQDIPTAGTLDCRKPIAIETRGNDLIVGKSYTHEIPEPGALATWGVLMAIGAAVGAVRREAERV